MNKKKLHLPLFVLMTSLGLNLTSYLTGQEANTLRHELESNQDSDASEFLRLKRDANGNPVSLQTAIVRYRNKDRTLLVDLIGAVHIGESDYYAKLNHQFDQYESLLYELVAPEGTRIPAGGKREGATNPISFLQSSAQTMLGLESQLELVDYQKENFVHADLSPADMQAKMAERGDTALSLGLSALSDMVRQQGQLQRQAQQAGGGAAEMTLGGLMEAMNDPLKLKLMLAEQFATSGAMDIGLGTKLNQLIVTDRNEAAINVLQRQIDNGDTKIGIFYGAAHMADFEKRFEALGLTPDEHVWVDAWDLTKSNSRPRDSAASMLMQLLDGLGK